MRISSLPLVRSKFACFRLNSFLSHPQTRLFVTRSQKKTIDIGFIGVGTVSTLHAQAISKIQDARLHGIWNRRPCPIVLSNGKTLEDRARELGQLAHPQSKDVPRVYSSAEELCQDPNIDAVYILTNVETHYQYAMMAIQKHKHVFIEKPVGNNVSECKELAKVAEEYGVRIMPGHNYIYEPSLYRTRELLHSGQLGKLVSIYILYNMHHPERVAARYPGVIRQILTHHSYLALYLLGDDKPIDLSAMKSTINDGTVPQENLALVTLKTKSGALVHLEASYANDDHSSDPWSFLLKVNGTLGTTRFSYNDWVVNKPSSVHSHTYIAYPDSIQDIGKHFIEQVIRNGRSPLSTIEDATLCQQMIEAAERSVDSHKHISLA